MLDMIGVGLLRHLVEETNAHVILSSTWRFGCRREENYLKRFSDFLGFTLADRTPFSNHGFRGDEINEWMRVNNIVQATKYVILDDDSDFHPDQLAHLVHTDHKEGFLFRDYEKALRLLSD